MSEEKKLKVVPPAKDNSEFMAAVNLVAAMISSESYMEDAQYRTGQRGDVYQTVVNDSIYLVKLIKETI